MTMKKAGGITLVFVILFSIAVLCVKLYERAVIYPKKYAEIIEKYSLEYGVDKNLMFAVVKTESGFDPEAVSHAGAIGLTQITEETYDWIKWKLNDEGRFSDLFDPETSVEYGAYFLGFLLDDFGNFRTAAAAYHAGRAKVHSWLENGDYSSDGKTLDVIPSKDTAHYVAKITKAYEKYNSLYR